MIETETKRRPGRPKKTEVKVESAVSESDMIECITIRKIGLADRTSEVNENISLERHIARKLQDTGAIKVKI